MRVLIDEDTAIQLAEILRLLLRGHQVDHVPQIGWKGKKDKYVLKDAPNAGYHALITGDRRQLNDPAECKAIKRSGLHHVTYSHRRQGTQGLALALGAVIAAMPMIMAELETTEGQRLVRIVGLDPHRRFEIQDPARQPPPYWPR
jgi:hypothetical protein